MMDVGMLERLSVSNSTARSNFSASGLLIQLRSHHPAGCLLSELVQVLDKNYIVRALVQVEGTTIATAMAAANEIEVAENRARDRVLEIIGLTPLNLPSAAVPLTAPAAVSSTGVVSAAVSTAVSTAVATHRMPDVAPTADPIDAPVSAEPDPTVASTVSKATRSKAAKATKLVERSKFEPVDEPVDAPGDEAGDAPEPIALTFSPDEMPTGEISGGDDDLAMEYEFTIEDESGEMAVEPPSAPVVPVMNEVIDLSDAIAQIGAEIDRIGWTKKQGSAYLQDTYSKRTRAELSEVEMLSFLNYLKSLPSKVQPALNDLPF
jgi:hypothetical protein